MAVERNSCQQNYHVLHGTARRLRLLNADNITYYDKSSERGVMTRLVPSKLHWELLDSAVFTLNKQFPFINSVQAAVSSPFLSNPNASSFTSGSAARYSTRQFLSVDIYSARYWRASILLRTFLTQ